MGALLMGFGIEGPIAVIDTENSSAELYAHMGEYDVCVLQAPFTPQKYTDAIHAAERAGYSVIIIDSLTHAWAGEGGLLTSRTTTTEKQQVRQQLAAWKDVTPLHRNLVEAMLQSPFTSNCDDAEQDRVCDPTLTIAANHSQEDRYGAGSSAKVWITNLPWCSISTRHTLHPRPRIARPCYHRQSFRSLLRPAGRLKDWLNTESPGGA